MSIEFWREGDEWVAADLDWLALAFAATKEEARANLRLELDEHRERLSQPDVGRRLKRVLDAHEPVGG